MYTVEQLQELTGYKINTIYTHSVGLKIKPIRGTFSHKQGKGLYSEQDLQKLYEYKKLISEGVSKEDAYRRIAC